MIEHDFPRGGDGPPQQHCSGAHSPKEHEVSSSLGQCRNREISMTSRIALRVGAVGVSRANVGGWGPIGCPRRGLCELRTPRWRCRKNWGRCSRRW